MMVHPYFLLLEFLQPLELDKKDFFKSFFFLCYNGFMNELMDQLDNLKDELDASSMVMDIRSLLKRIEGDTELSSMLKDYQVRPNDELKNKILESDLFQEYKIKETVLNLFIMEVNQRLGKITKKGGCGCESH